MNNLIYPKSMVSERKFNRLHNFNQLFLELQAILFLHACNYNEDAAKKTIDTFFTVKTMDPGLFKMRNPRNSPINNSLDVM